ncbi:hypothetical protein PF005_g21649 [Phytophthora fragariae]|uniref:Uncharacterized protein n=1 Tax=Phytophthora fragariae TaxID=53985 RepID=A0A6A3WG82_9STRA|nr:hypothetical protein PF003_g35772 [Phytophthora fragariae]KAE8927246.1 hypothetical protein PF009_g22585 [Phytophthora fragariae]KAE8985495.1 hypothetical protein PF011_g20366 [Phytophthora fragariae]KAE9083670.1 hypothetical protein PF010_g21124 [Phytophthora fragariae]KAE9086850.1 hypothetical protein PF007_g20606 [Phytophthora fragariae]
MVEEYQHSYMTKEKGGLKSSAAVMLTALRDMEKYPSVAEDSGTYERQAKYLATRTVNAFTGATEWPHQLMAYALAGHKSYVSSDTFWYVFPRQLLSYIEGEDDDAEEDSEDNWSSPSEGDDETRTNECARKGDQDQVEYNADSCEEEFDRESEVSIQIRLERLITSSMEELRPGKSSSGNPQKAGARMFTAGDKVFFVSQAESYRHRGSWFEAYSPVEF